jgi:alpha-galactosidase
MAIKIDSKHNIINIQAGETSYIIKVTDDGLLAHLYWGKLIIDEDLSYLLRLEERCSFSPNANSLNPAISPDTLPQEYPAYGAGDFRHPAFQLQLENGSTITDLRVQSYRVFKGKQQLKGLPSVYIEDTDEADTLQIELLDSLIGFRVILSYSAYRNSNVITRSVKLINEGNKTFSITKALSCCVDFPDDNYSLLHLEGAWARERHIVSTPITQGSQLIESRRGASGHQLNPFIALLRENANEKSGEVFGFSLVYSGSFLAQVEVDQFRTTRVSMGINPFDFSWKLESGEEFQTPETVMVYSYNGIGEMSRTYHKLYRTRLCRGKFRDKVRPILINNWEATYFDFDAKKLENIALEASKLGIELFVLDDGWFGKRDSDNCSLGDWFVDKRKLPKGLKNLAERINSLGMEFGLWFEPEMISPDSKLYRAHPDWCLHVPDRARTQARKQLVLDFSRQDVCDAITDMLKNILSSAPIAYVKWDMNRNMTEIGSELLSSDRQRETAHRYMLGLYSVIDKLTSMFPNVLFESCSGGGGRFDPGMLYYMPQTWTSDDTDAVERLKIQYGTSIVYPVSTMGSHVSAVPNHQVHRSTPLKTRGDVAMSGIFGYELDLTKLSDEEKRIIKNQVETYKELRHLIQFGDMYRLLSPFEGNDAAWMFVSEKKEEAYITYCKVLAKPNEPLKKLRLDGLDPNKDYKIDNSDLVLSGGFLMNAGLHIPFLEGDFRSITWRLKSI